MNPIRSIEHAMKVIEGQDKLIDEQAAHIDEQAAHIKELIRTARDLADELMGTGATLHSKITKKYLALVGLLNRLEAK